MAAGKSKTSTSTVKILEKKKVNNKGIHAKSKTSKNKKSKNYQKPYRGQGKRR